MVALTRLSLYNRAVIALLSLVILAFGLFSTSSLKQELWPSLTMPGASVVAVYPGAPPETVERDVTKPLEDAAKSVAGVTKVSSTSSANVSQIQVQWDYNEDSGQLESKLRTAVDATKSTLPQDVEPQVSVGNLDDFPVMMLAVASDLNPQQLSEALNNAAVPRLKQIEGVREANVSGEQENQVVITTRQADLDRLNVETSQLTQLLEAYKSSMPGGQLVQSGRNVSVQVGRGLGSVEDVADLRLQGTDGPVRLGDVADVRSTPVDSSSISRVNGQPALSLSVTKTQDANTVSVSHGVNEALPEIGREIGHNTTFTPVFDQAPYIEDSIHNLATEGGLGLVMAILVIMVFLLSLRSTLITAISIPLSLLIAMIGLHVGGYTLNLLTLSGLTVAIGRVVDDSIVVIENIKRHLGLGEEFGVDLVLRAVREVAGAITASTITTVAVFLPLGLVSGQTGEMFRPFALTVTMALLASLLVALTIVPVLAFWFMKPSRKQLAKTAGERKRASHESRETPLQRAYLPVLRLSLAHPLITVLVAGLVFGGTMVGATQLKTDLFGDSGQTSIQVDQELPMGTSLEATDAAAKKVEAILAAEPAVKSYQTTVGGGGMMAAMTGNAGATNTGSFSVTLEEGSNGTEIANRLRDELGKLPDAGKIEVVTAGGAGASNNLEVLVRGRDVAELARGSQQVAAMMESVPGLTQVSTDLAEQQTVFQVNVREDDASRLGMNQGTVGLAVNQALRGQQLGQVTIDEQAQDLILRSREPVRTKQELESLMLPVTQKQTADEQKRISDQLTEQQDAQAAEQEQKANDQLAEQEDQLAKQKDELDDQISQLTTQIAQVESGGAAAAGQFPGGGLPGAGSLPGGGLPDAAGAAAQQGAAAMAQAQEAQIQGLRDSLAKLREQRSALDEQEQKLQESRADAATQKRRSEEMKQLSEDAKNAKGTPVPLSAVADVVEVPTPATVNRADGERTVTVSAVPVGGDLGAASQALTDGLAQVHLPTGVQAEIAGASNEQDEAFTQLGVAMLAAIAIVYLVMVATFRSLIQPLILLISVPFAATGAVGLLLATGTALGVPSMIGLLMLIGIVVTNAIVLIDLVNHYRAEGASIDDAVIHGARLRLRPIVMTALATIFALIPMAIGITGGSIFISKSLAIVVIGGLVSSTVLTLILVPVLYHLVEKFRERLHHRRRREPEEAPAQ